MSLNSRKSQEIRKVLNAADGRRGKMKMEQMLNMTKLLKSMKTASVGERRRARLRVLLSWGPAFNVI